MRKFKAQNLKTVCIFYLILTVVILSGALWGIYKKEYILLINAIIPIGFIFNLPVQYRLTENDKLDVRNLFGSMFKPISVSQIIRITQRSKNEFIVVYKRDRLRGDRIIRLSETDMKDFLNELLGRNPAIEIKTNTLYEKKSLHS